MPSFLVLLQIKDINKAKVDPSLGSSEPQELGCTDSWQCGCVIDFSMWFGYEMSHITDITTFWSGIWYVLDILLCLWQVVKCYSCYSLSLTRMPECSRTHCCALDWRLLAACGIWNQDCAFAKSWNNLDLVELTMGSLPRCMTWHPSLLMCPSPSCTEKHISHMIFEWWGWEGASKILGLSLKAGQMRCSQRHCCMALCNLLQVSNYDDNWVSM